MNTAFVLSPWCDDVRPMTVTERDELLRVLRIEAASPSASYLTQLQWAFLKCSPFHNLELLAGVSPRTVEACIEAVLTGRGGPCHVQATAFLALLKSLGFEAHLCAGTISEPGDHLLVLVHTPEAAFVCDVGNGQPYRKPFPLHGTSTSDHVGWHFGSRGDGQRVTLSRHLDDGTWKHVYSVDPSRQHFSDFAGIIAGHHESVGFGPFLTGLRAVLIRDDLVVTLRDFQLRRYSAAGICERYVADRKAAHRVLDKVFGLGSAPVESAFARIGARMSTWGSQLGPQPRMVVSLSTTGRPENLVALLGSLEQEWRRTTCTGGDQLLVVIVENSVGHADRHQNLATVEEAVQRGSLAIQLVDDGVYGRPIAASRVAQVQALARLHQTGREFDAVWMLDDDIQLAQLQVLDGRLHKTNDIRYFDRIAAYYCQHPEASVLVGGVCGDPPIRPDAVLGTQLFDLECNLERFASLDPRQPYPKQPQRTSFSMADYYYDHSRAGVAHLVTPFLWLGAGPDATVRDEALAFVEAMTGAFWGKTPTRPLLHEPRAQGEGLRSCVLRGGNTVFLDVEALFRHAYPAMRIGSVTTRRSDMVGATLLDRSGGTWFAHFPCPVLHDRKPEHATSPEPDGEAVLASIESEFYGVLLARAVMTAGGTTHGFQQEATARSELILTRLREASARTQRASAAIHRAKASWLGEDDELRAALERLQVGLDRARRRYLGGDDPKGCATWLERVATAIQDPERWAALESFARHQLEAETSAHVQTIAAILQEA